MNDEKILRGIIMNDHRFESYLKNIKPHMTDKDEDGHIKDWLLKHEFFAAPASSKYHGNYEGGLHDHSMNVTMNLVNFTTNLGLTWERPESPWIVGYFHDLCKVDQYLKKPGKFFKDELHMDDGYHYEYNKQTLLKGHGEKSVMLLSQMMTLTEEEIACITYHMGAFCDKEKWGDFTDAIHDYPNVLWTHTADMMATHINEVGAAR